MIATLAKTTLSCTVLAVLAVLAPEPEVLASPATWEASSFRAVGIYALGLLHGLLVSLVLLLGGLHASAASMAAELPPAEDKQEAAKELEVVPSPPTATPRALLKGLLKPSSGGEVPFSSPVADIMMSVDDYEAAKKQPQQQQKKSSRRKSVPSAMPLPETPPPPPPPPPAEPQQRPSKSPAARSSRRKSLPAARYSPSRA